MALPAHLNYQLDVLESIICLVDTEYERRQMKKKNDEEAVTAVSVSKVTTEDTPGTSETQSSLFRDDPELNLLQDEIDTGIRHLARTYKEIHEQDLKYFYLSGDAVDLNTYGRQLMSWTEEIRKDLIYVRTQLRLMRKEREGRDTALRLVRERRERRAQETQGKMANCEKRVKDLSLSLDGLDHLVAEKSEASTALLRFPLTVPAALRTKFGTRKSMCELDTRLNAIRSGFADLSATRSKIDAEANCLSEDIKAEKTMAPGVPSRTTEISVSDLNLDSLVAGLVSQNLPLVTSHVLEECSEDFKKLLQDTYEHVLKSFESAWNLIHWVVKVASDGQQPADQVLEERGEIGVSEFESVAANELWRSRPGEY